MRQPKDTTYFNAQMFVYANEELRAKLKEVSASERVDVYMLVDEACRDLLKKKGVVFENKPKVAVMQ